MKFIITYWVEFIFGIMITIMGYLLHKATRYYQTIVSSVTGVRVLLKTKIIEEYTIVKKQETISMYQKQNMLDLYQEYKKLGSDELLEDMMKEIDSIPLEKC